MKITQHHPLNFLTTISYEIKGGEIIKTFKGLRGEMVFIIDIKNIKRVYSYRTTNDGFINVGLLLFAVCYAIDIIPGYFGLSREWRRIFFNTSVVLAVAALVNVTLSFIKHDWVGFQDMNNHHIFGIRDNGKKEEKEFIDYIKHEISEENNDLELAEIKKRCDLATKSPWKSMIEGRDHVSGSNFIMTGTPEDRGDDIELTGATIEDQDFIAHARQDIPRLLEIINHLREKGTHK